MFELKLPLIPYYSNNIEPGGLINTIHLQIMTGSTDHAPHTLFSDGIRRIAPIGRRPGFDLHKNNKLIIFRDNIDFIARNRPIPFYNTVTFFLEIGYRSRFSLSTQFIVLRHLFFDKTAYKLCKNTNLHYKLFFLAEIFCFFALAKEMGCRNFNDYLMRTKQYKPQGKVKPRTKKAIFMLSEEEYNLIHFYLKKYKITNRSRWFRETVLNHVLKNMEQDYPTLFEENEMRR